MIGDVTVRCGRDGGLEMHCVSSLGCVFFLLFVITRLTMCTATMTNSDWDPCQSPHPTSLIVVTTMQGTNTGSKWCLHMYHLDPIWIIKSLRIHLLSKFEEPRSTIVDAGVVYCMAQENCMTTRKAKEICKLGESAKRFPTREAIQTNKGKRWAVKPIF